HPGYLLRYLPGVTANEMDITPPVSKDKTVDATGQMSLKDNGFYLAPFSSRGPTARNIRKPDVVAPGVNIMAAKSKYPKPTTLHGGYIEKSGTSMAAPFVAGVAALMLDANYARTPANIKSYIRASAQEWGVSGCDFDYGCGLIRAYKAVGYAKTGSIPAGDQWTPKHSRHNAYMTDTVSSKYYTKTISSDAYPFAATLIMYDWSGYNYGVDLDLYVYDPDGNIIAGSSGIYRQDTVSVAPDDLGRYKTRVYKYIGSGRYSLDISEV
ncbi:S8 family serine peptidase, partial [bacterium]|nr:S8 family serine peptidase [bacterium]